MSELRKMDSFFFISSIGFVVFAILLAIALVYVILLLRSMSRIARTVEEETESIREDLDDVRESIKREGANAFSTLWSLLGFVRKTGKRVAKKRRNS
jgi:hypothetical protein